MSASEFGLWMAFDSGEPVFADAQLHLWAALMAATHNGPLVKRDKSLWQASDFIGQLWKPPAPPPDPKRKKTNAAAELRGMLTHLARNPRARRKP